MVQRNGFLLAAVLFFSVTMVSCTDCYECTRQVEIQDSSGQVVDVSEDTDEFCTVDEAEVNQKESEGYNCTSSPS